MTSVAVQTFVIEPIWNSDSGVTSTPVAVPRTPAAVSVITPSWRRPSVAPGTRWRRISSASRSCQAAASNEPVGGEPETGVGIRSSVRGMNSGLSPSLRAGVVGTGFVGVVHVHALRLLGVDVAGVVGSSPERAAAKGLAPVYDSLEALLADRRSTSST